MLCERATGSMSYNLFPWFTQEKVIIKALRHFMRSIVILDPVTNELRKQGGKEENRRYEDIPIGAAKMGRFYFFIQGNRVPVQRITP